MSSLSSTFLLHCWNLTRPIFTNALPIGCKDVLELVCSVDVSCHAEAGDACVFGVKYQGPIDDVEEQVDVRGVGKKAGHGLKHPSHQLHTEKQCWFKQHNCDTQGRQVGKKKLLVLTFTQTILCRVSIPRSSCSCKKKRIMTVCGVLLRKHEV